MSTTTRKPRGVKAKKQRTFTITFTIEGTDYQVSPLPIDPAVGHKAFRFAKQAGDGEVYDLHADTYGLQCQCKGFLAHGHCKNVQTIQAAGKVFNVRPVSPEPAPAKPAPKANAYRSTADLARNDPEAYRALQGDWSGYPDEEPMSDDDMQQMAEYYGE